MPLFTTSQEWLSQSTLLLQARPTTARITSKYSVLSPTSTRITKKRSKRTPKPAEPTSDAAAPAQPLAAFTLKTYDPVSGACLKYRTDKAAEVGRLVACLGRLGRSMAALPEESEEAMADAKDEGEERSVEQKGGNAGAVVQQAPAQGGGGKKKKKGKK